MTHSVCFERLLRWRNAVAVIGFVFATVALPSHAGLVTFSFTGTVDHYEFLNGDPSLDPFAGAPPAFGDTFSGAYVFESTTADGNPGSGGLYHHTGPIFVMTLTLNGVTFIGGGSGESLDITTMDTSFFDFYGVAAKLGALDMEINLSDGTGTGFSSEALPLTPPSLAVFSPIDSVFVHNNDINLEYQLVGTLTTLTCTAGCAAVTVPEPWSPALVLLGLVGIVVAKRGRRALSA